MTDPYRLAPAPAPARPAEPAVRHRLLRVVLWVTLVPATAINVAGSVTGHSVFTFAAGALATCCAAGLVVSHVTGRAGRKR
ncbi:hypothetical protein [Longispora albida]|uniref:hypothetical protein n=1 Tax=Longispora albida TaxID=203523 RepID=UPI000361455F|nr:hypothetical protein [Longispora albida]